MNTNAAKALPIPDLPGEDSARFLATLLSNLPGLVYRCRNDLHWTMDYMGGGVEDLTGYPAASFVEERSVQWGDLIHPDDREHVWMVIQTALHRRVPFQLEYRIRTRSGEIRWVWEQGRGILVGGREMEAMEGFITDITSRREAEGRNRESSERLEAIIAASPIAIFALDDLGRVTMWNAAAERIFGWAGAELMGQALPDVLSESLAANATESDRRNGKGDAGLLEACWTRRDGTPVDVQVAVATLGGPDGAEGGRLVLATDITERRILEQQFLQAQKMEAVGRLAGGIGHDFNNILTGIRGFGQIIVESLGEHDPLREDAGEIVRAADRAADLTRQLLTFSRKQRVEPALVDLNAVVRGLERMLGQVIGAHVGLELHLDSAIPGVFADSGHLEQVVMNLAVNARDAMPEGGRLVIETEEVVLDDEYARMHPDTAPGRYVRLAVTDSGCGMDAATQVRIFDPFFTTKEEGTGLGLSTVYGIVHQAGGVVSVYSEPGNGTVFRVYLPVAAPEPIDGPRESAKDAVEAGPDASGGETILIVEDHDAVRQLVERVLSGRGYRVAVAESAREALDMVARNRGCPDLLITDVVMAEVSGAELANRLREMDPAMKVLYISGYRTRALAGPELAPSDDFLGKPFTPDVLLAKVREVLA